MAEFSISYNKYEQFKSDGNKILSFKLVRDVDKILDKEDEFAPAMCHQTFGYSEMIFGYTGLSIEFMFVASTLELLLLIKYSSKVNPKDHDGMQPDDLMASLKTCLPFEYSTNVDSFATKIDDKFLPFGSKLTQYSVESELQSGTFEIYKCDIEEKGFRKYIERFQTFIMFFLDGSVFIDLDDLKFNYYVVYEKYKKDSETRYASVGFMISYNFYAYPEMVRPRICQMLILPPFQRQGHCSSLLQCFYSDCILQKHVRDITVEDASENFQRVRDIIDAKNCYKLSCFQKEKINSGFNKVMVATVAQKLKINKIKRFPDRLTNSLVKCLPVTYAPRYPQKQARRIYEILRYRHTDLGDEIQFKAFKDSVLVRLGEPYKKNGRHFAKSNQNIEALTAAQEQEKKTNMADEFEKCLRNYEAISGYLH